jgi:hypothetical protein
MQWFIGSCNVILGPIARVFAAGNIARTNPILPEWQPTSPVDEDRDDERSHGRAAGTRIRRERTHRTACRRGFGANEAIVTATALLRG